MVTVYDVEASKLISAVAERLKTDKIVNPPKWVFYVKSGPHADRAPEDVNFWYMRCAAILRRLYIGEPVGTGRLREIYGGRKNMGAGRDHTVKSGGSIIRKALQQLEAAALIKKGTKGRAITSKGIALVDSAARKVKA